MKSIKAELRNLRQVVEESPKINPHCDTAPLHQASSVRASFVARDETPVASSTLTNQQVIDDVPKNGRRELCALIYYQNKGPHITKLE
ncbi:hypothetical protein ElyMa_000268700 [Elysia marginata]|uniref:Uncharacterized protein n=1 Tax=Elysia marginata TaxID=1093978 RepID=A0AAV4F411_9GAST|nr:hypothetical protein ElyMa_000268700 [Elysia marginata]